jgi:hypothetical protein
MSDISGAKAYKLGFAHLETALPTDKIKLDRLGTKITGFRVGFSRGHQVKYSQLSPEEQLKENARIKKGLDRLLFAVGHDAYTKYAGREGGAEKWRERGINPLDEDAANIYGKFAMSIRDIIKSGLGEGDAEHRVTVKEVRSILKKLNREVRHAKTDFDTHLTHLKAQWKERGSPSFPLERALEYSGRTYGGRYDRDS